MTRRRRAVAWRALALTSSLAMILTLLLTPHAWWWLAALLLTGVWACEKAAQRVDSHAWRRRLDQFGDNP